MTRKTNHVFQILYSNVSEQTYIYKYICYYIYIYILTRIYYWSQDFWLMVTHMCPCLHTNNHVIWMVVWRPHRFRVFVLPLVHGPSPGIHKEVADCSWFKPQLPGYGYLHFLWWPFRFLMNTNIWFIYYMYFTFTI